MFNLGSSYFHVALTTVRHLLIVNVQTAVHVTSTATTIPALRRHLDAAEQRRQQQRQQRSLQRRQSHRDDYGYYYNDDDDWSYDYYDARPRRSASACSFRDVTDSSDDDSGLCVRRIAVGVGPF